MKKSGIQARPKRAVCVLKTSKVGRGVTAKIRVSSAVSSAVSPTARIRSQVKVASAKNLAKTSVAQQETRILHMGATATRRASRQALASGLSITVAEKNQVVKIAPGGQRTFVKDIAPDVFVKQKKMRLN